MFSNPLKDILLALANSLYEPRLKVEANTIKDNTPSTIEKVNKALALVGAKATRVEKVDLFNTREGTFLFPCRKPVPIVEVIVHEELHSYNSKNEMTHKKHFIVDTLLRTEAMIFKIEPI